MLQCIPRVVRPLMLMYSAPAVSHHAEVLKCTATQPVPDANGGRTE